jgi:hypothetical protein
MAHLKSTKTANVPLTATISVECTPEVMIGVLQKPDGSYAAYGYHFYTEETIDENNEVTSSITRTILNFEEPLPEEVVNQLAQLVDTTGMSETERRHAQLVVGAKAILSQKKHWGLTGDDYQEVTN